MVILGNFEVTILLPRHETSDVMAGASTTTWQPITEHDPPYLTTADQGPSTSSQKYIGITPTIDLEQQHHYEFAIDFKVHCGFTFLDGDDVEYLVFRTYLDNIKIGSAFVKRERWERSGTYRVRKKGRRYWVDELQSWVQKPWELESGLHGTLKIEVWRESSGRASSGSWDHPDFFGEGNIYDSGNAITLNDFNGGLPKMPRVRHTRKVDLWPMATFVYEYRSHDTLRVLGVTKPPASAMKSTIDLTEMDDEPPASKLTGETTTEHESEDFWSSIGSGTAASDPLDDLSEQTQLEYKYHESDDISTMSNTSLDITSSVQDGLGYRSPSAYHEQAYEPAEAPRKPLEAQMQETESNISHAAEVVIVDLTMLD